MTRQSGNLDPKTLVLIWDTGASYVLIQFWIDFIDYVKYDIHVKDVTKTNKVVDIDTTLHKMVDKNGKEVFFLCILYHLTRMNVQLF